MRSAILAASLLASLCACNPEPPLSNADRTKFVFELIEDGKACDGFRARLEAPGLEPPAITSIYKEAIKAGCIKRDV